MSNLAKVLKEFEKDQLEEEQDHENKLHYQDVEKSNLKPASSDDLFGSEGESEDEPNSGVEEGNGNPIFKFYTLTVTHNF